MPSPSRLVVRFYISMGKVQGFSCTAGDPVYMAAPGQFNRDINPKVSGTGNSFQDQATESVSCILWLPESPGTSRG